MSIKELSWYNPKRDGIIINRLRCIIIKDVIIFNPINDINTDLDLAKAILNVYGITPKIIHFRFKYCYSHYQQVFIYLNDVDPLRVQFNAKAINDLISPDFSWFYEFREYVTKFIGYPPHFTVSLHFDVTNINKLNKYYSILFNRLNNRLTNFESVSKNEMEQFIKTVKNLHYEYRYDKVIRISKNKFSVFGLVTSDTLDPFLKKHVDIMVVLHLVANLLKATGCFDHFINNNMYRNLKNS